MTENWNYNCTQVIKIFNRNRDKNVIRKDCNKMFIAEERYLFTLWKAKSLEGPRTGSSGTLNK